MKLVGMRNETWTSEGLSKISSGVAKAGPLSSLQQAPQPSTQTHDGSFLLCPKPTFLVVFVGFGVAFLGVSRGR